MAKRSFRGGGSFFDYKLRPQGIQAKVTRANGKVVKFGKEMEAVNREAVQQMSKWAVEELNRHIRRDNKGDWKSGGLAKALLAPDTHYVSAYGFEFMLTEKMNDKVVNKRAYQGKDGETKHHKGTYWRAIEYGLSQGFVGRVVPLQFLDPHSRPIPLDSSRSGTILTGYDRKRKLRAGAAVGGLDRGRNSRPRKPRKGLLAHTAKNRSLVKIRHAIQPYHYAEYAETRFLAGDKAFYKKLVDQHAALLRESGIVLEVVGL